MRRYIYQQLCVGCALSLFVAAHAHAQCSADVSFRSLYTDQADTSSVNPAVRPTVTGLRLPVDDTDIVNKLYVDRVRTSATAYLPVTTNIDNDSPLAIDFAGNEIVSTPYKHINTSSAGAFFSDSRAAHPRSHRPESRYQIDTTYPSVFTEEERADNQDQRQITRYFLNSNLLKLGDDLDTTVGMQALVEVPPDVSGDALGTLGGFYSRYRDANQYVDQWSNWQRLDNREVDAQFARVDYLRLDGNIVSVDTRTPFSDNLPFDPSADVEDARQRRTNTNSIPLHIAAKGTGVIRFGNHNNSQHTGGNLGATDALSIAGSAQLVHAQNALQLDSANSVFDMRDANLFNMSDFTVVSVGATSAVGRFADIRANTQAQTARLSSTNAIPLVFRGANSQVVFGDGSDGDRHLLSDIGTATVGNNNLILARNSISTSNGTLTLRATAGLTTNNRLDNISRLHIGQLAFDDRHLTSTAGTIVFDADNNVIDFDGRSWSNVAGGITIDETIDFEVLRIDDLTFTNHTISSSTQDITLDANSNTINFSRGELTNINEMLLDTFTLRDGSIEASGQINITSTGNTLAFSGDAWRDVSRIAVDELSINSANVTASGTLTLAASNNIISFNNNSLQGINELRVGNLHLTDDGIRATANSDLEINAGGGTLDFNESTLDNIASIAVDDLQITTDGIAGTGTANQDIFISSNADIALDAGGVIDFGDRPLDMSGTSSADSDAASRGYVDGRALNDLVTANGTVDMNGHRITNLGTPVNDNDAANIGYIGSNTEITNLASGELDIDGFRAVNIESDVNDVSSPLLLRDVGEDVSDQKIEVAVVKFLVNTHGQMSYIDGTPAGSVTGNLKFIYATGRRDGNNDDGVTNFDDQRVVGFYWDQDNDARRAWVSVYCTAQGRQGSVVIVDSMIYIALDQTTLANFSQDATLQIPGSFADIESYVHRSDRDTPLVTWQDDNHTHYTSMVNHPVGYPVEHTIGNNAQTVSYNDLPFDLPAATGNNKRVVYVISPHFDALQDWAHDVDANDGFVSADGDKNDPNHPQHVDAPDYGAERSRLSQDRALGYCTLTIRILPAIFF